MVEPLFYTGLAEYYDKIYHYIDYKKQADFFLQLTKNFKKSKGNKLLDVACGTGTHINFLKKYFEVVGLDKSNEMLEIAKNKNPGLKFIQDDMRTFNLKETFDVIVCYFNSILYNKTKSDLVKALTNFYNHLNSGGILIFNAVDKLIGINSKKQDFWYRGKKLKILFSPQWIYRGRKMYIDVDFVIKMGKQQHHLKDLHMLGAFDLKQIESMARKTGFKVSLLESNYKEIKPIKTGDWQAIFVCQKL